jgi:hypothetical protein
LRERGEERKPCAFAGLILLWFIRSKWRRKRYAVVEDDAADMRGSVFVLLRPELIMGEQLFFFLLLFLIMVLLGGGGGCIVLGELRIFRHDFLS